MLSSSLFTTSPKPLSEKEGLLGAQPKHYDDHIVRLLAITWRYFSVIRFPSCGCPLEDFLLHIYKRNKYNGDVQRYSVS